MISCRSCRFTTNIHDYNETRGRRNRLPSKCRSRRCTQSSKQVSVFSFFSPVSTCNNCSNTKCPLGKFNKGRGQEKSSNKRIEKERKHILCGKIKKVLEGLFLFFFFLTMEKNDKTVYKLLQLPSCFLQRDRRIGSQDGRVRSWFESNHTEGS